MVAKAICGDVYWKKSKEMYRILALLFAGYIGYNVANYRKTWREKSRLVMREWQGQNGVFVVEYLSRGEDTEALIWTSDVEKAVQLPLGVAAGLQRMLIAGPGGSEMRYRIDYAR